jgi:hypothetical protein
MEDHNPKHNQALEDVENLDDNGQQHANAVNDDVIDSSSTPADLGRGTSL